MRINALESAILIVLVPAVFFAGCSGDDVSNNYLLTMAVEVETTELPDATEGSLYGFTLVASGGSGSHDWSLEPGCVNNSWLVLDTSTGALSGVPGVSSIGAVTLVVRATDRGNSANFDVRSFAFSVRTSPSIVRITTQSLPHAFVNLSYYFTLSADGGSGQFSWSKITGGTNDAWITVGSTGYIQGFPSSSYIGPVKLKVRAVDKVDPALFVSATFDFRVYGGTITIENNNPLMNAAASAQYNFLLRASGGSGSYFWSKETGGSNDSWITVNPSSGVVTGTAPSALGPVTLVVGAADTSNPAVFAVKTLHFEIKSIALTVESLPDAFVGMAFSQALGVAGSAAAATYSIEPGGSNYGWLSIVGSSIVSASGPSSGDIGAVTVLVRVTIGALMDTRPYSLHVYQGPAINPIQADAQVGVGFSVLPSAAGGTGKFVWTLEPGGTNDDWITVDAETGRMSGTPVENDLGPVSLTLKVAENGYPSISDTETVSFQVRGISIDTTFIPDAGVNLDYSCQLASTGGSGYRGWTIDTGPSWLQIDQDTGLLYGKPLATASHTVTVRVTDSIYSALTETKTYSFWVVTSVFQETFEAGTTGWTLATPWARGTRDPASTTDRYYVGPQKTRDGLYCCGTNMTGLYTDYLGWAPTLTSPAMNLSGTTAPVLVYYQWIQTEPNDGCNVKISVNGTVGPFSLLTTVTPAYNGTVNTQAAWTGFLVPRSGWQRVVVDLSAYNTQTNVSIQWCLYTNSNGITNPGWYVDSIHVFDPPAASVPMQVENPTPTDGCTFAPPTAADFSGGLKLRWERATGAASYDLYIGTDYNTVSQATVPDQAGIAGDSATVTTLSSGNTYYWRIDSQGGSATKGKVWSFTTANPVRIMVNEIQMYSFYGPYVEIYNPSSSVSQDVSGYVLWTSSGGASLRSFVLPQGLVLGPMEAKVFADAIVYYHSFTQYRAWDIISLPHSIGWTAGTSQGEAWLLDSAGTGVDYVGWNVTISHKPSDLGWSGTLTQSNSFNSILRRTGNTDNDQAGDFRWDYVANYGPGYGYMGLKDAGQ